MLAGSLISKQPSSAVKSNWKETDLCFWCLEKTEQGPVHKHPSSNASLSLLTLIHPAALGFPNLQNSFLSPFHPCLFSPFSFYFFFTPLPCPLEYTGRQQPFFPLSQSFSSPFSWAYLLAWHRTQESGSRTQDPRPRIQDPGRRTQDPGRRTQDPGLRTQDPEPLCYSPLPHIAEITDFPCRDTWSLGYPFRVCICISISNLLAHSWYLRYYI